VTPEPSAPPPARWGLGDVGTGILASFALSTLVGGTIVSLAGWTDGRIPVWGLALLQLPLWAGYVGAVLLAGSKGGGVVADFGLRQRPRDVPVGLVVGVLTQVIGVWLVYLPVLRLTGIDPEELSRPARELASRADSAWGWVLFALIVGLGAPVVEELFYRGLFLRALTKRGMGDVGAVVVTSLVFALVHLQLLQFLGLATFGLVAGALTVRTRRLGPAIWAHVGFNLTTVLALYLGR
jgi:membrane protease YdiL (CAAX protease family)